MPRSPPLYHVTLQSFPPPLSTPPSRRLAFAQARQHSYIIICPSSEPPSPIRHAAAQRIYSLQPTTSQSLQIPMQDVTPALLGIPSSRTSSANMRAMWKAATVRMRSTRPSKSDRSHMEIGLGGMISPMSRSALRYMDLRLPRRCFPPLLHPCHPITPRRPFYQLWLHPFYLVCQLLPTPPQS